MRLIFVPSWPPSTSGAMMISCPVYLDEEEEKLRKDGSIAFWRRITLEVSDAEFDRLFYPPAEMLKATASHCASGKDLSND
jgi:hypothetical protein